MKGSAKLDGRQALGPSREYESGDVLHRQAREVNIFAGLPPDDGVRTTTLTLAAPNG
jgi:hypothetical protein